jgi:hypothetical protein
MHAGRSEQTGGADESRRHRLKANPEVQTGTLVLRTPVDRGRLIDRSEPVCLDALARIVEGL